MQPISSLKCLFQKLNLLVVVAMVALSAGCAGTQVAPQAEDGQSAVTKRAQARWGALKAGDLDTAYTFISPASRSVLTRESFKSKGGLVTWKEAAIKSVVCQAADACTVEVDARYVYRARTGGRLENIQVMNEKWGKVAGEWWYIPAEVF